MNDRALVFTGLVRDEPRFIDFLDRLNSHLEIERHPIYFSTWLGELEKYPRAASKLNDLGAMIIEQRQPDLRLPGHILHQLVALDAALNFIDPDAFVFKTRPDFADFSAYQSFLKADVSRATSGPFGHVSAGCKIHVMGCFLAQPFYINDITYCALARDLIRVVALPFTALTRYHRMAPEQLIWGGRTIGSIRVLDTYFRVNTGLIFDDVEKVAAHIRMLQEFDSYAFALAAYFFNLHANYRSVHPPTATEFDFVYDVTLEDLLWGRVDSPIVAFHTTAYTNSFRKIELVEKILNGEFRGSRFGDKVLEAIKKLKSIERPEEYLTPELQSSAENYCEAVKTIEVRGGKLAIREKNRIRIEGADPIWAQQQTGTPLTERLENEVNYLRRSNNDLQERLRKALL
jgi:hypothetical protein